MSDTTKIEWCDATWNGWLGCTQVSPGCDGCYAMQETPVRVLRGQGRETWGPKAERHRTSQHNWKQPRRWNERPFVECVSCGWRGEVRAFKRTDPQGAHHSMCPECAGVDYRSARRRVFCSSLCDVFDNQVPIEWLVDVLRWWMETPSMDKLVLTKRVSNVLPRLFEAWGTLDGPADPLFAWLGAWLDGKPPRDVWLGITVVNQEEAYRDIPKLAATRAAVRFLSIEPMLGAIDLRLVTKTWAPGRCNHCCNGDRCDDRSHYDRPYCPHCRGTGGQPVHWVICGGESGPNARPMHPEWARSLRDQCAEAGVPFLFKQWGEWGPDWEGAATCNACGRTKFDAINSHGECGHCGIDAWNLASRPLESLRRSGKKAAGRLLDGRVHNGFPEAQA